MKRIRLFWHNYSYLVKQWVAIAIFAIIGYYFFEYCNRKDRNLVKYLDAHKCESLGQVGVSGQRVYKCDNGLHLENDLRKETDT